jgi:diguanylate cyclase (GGDEF)-like protein
MRDSHLFLSPDDLHKARARKVAQRSAGFLFSAAGYAFTVIMLVAFREAGVSEFETIHLVALVLFNACGVALFYAAVRTGYDRVVGSWDRHFVYTPMAFAVLMFNLYIALVPEARALVLMAWLVAMVLTAGYGTLWPMLGLNAATMAGYLTVVLLAARLHPEIVVVQEILLAVVFLITSGLMALTLERLRSARQQVRLLTEEMRALAMTDSLTGLYNRRSLDELLEVETARFARFGHQFAIAILDVDDFKVYNDTHGHPAGDSVLAEVARLVRQHTRSTDVAFRYGGEELAVILPETSIDDAVAVMERVRERICLHEFPGKDVMPKGRVTVSVGVARCPDHGRDPQTLIQAADQALYAAKHAGKDTVRVAPRTLAAGATGDTPL